MAEEVFRYDGETAFEAEARRKTTVRLSKQQWALVNKLIDTVCMPFCDLLSGNPLRPYQIPFARRFFESVLTNDGNILTALFCRQSGKTETVADVVATVMILVPRLAKIYHEELPTLKPYLKGVKVGAFGPVDEQADNLYGRITGCLTSPEAEKILQDKEIDEVVKGRGKLTYLVNCRSEVRKTTCHPKAKIEGRTYHIILIDECQEADSKTVKKSVNPMGTATNATRVWTGTPTYEIGIFYEQILKNKRKILEPGNHKVNHFEVPWREVAKYVDTYERYVLREMTEMGAESDEFKLSYELIWILERGMYTTDEEFENLCDRSVQKLEKTWHYSPVCVGIDCARKKDRTVLTVVWVRWDQTDSMGFHDHRVLNWLDLTGLDWETQYMRMVEFLSAYKIHKVGVDTGGVGDVVIDRLRNLMPHVEFIEMLDSPQDQSKRFKYLKSLKERRMIKWPGGSKVRELKSWKRFKQDMHDAVLDYNKSNMKVASPDNTDAHDDYVDSLAMACFLTKEDPDDGTGQSIQVADNPFFSRR